MLIVYHMCGPAPVSAVKRPTGFTNTFPFDLFCLFKILASSSNLKAGNV